MAREVKLNHVESVLRELSYPISREDAAERFDDVTLVLAEGEKNLGEHVSQMSDAEFESADDLENEVFNNLPRRAVGEPYQSEGEG
ncbi:DUF5789 family protein [Haladaptatus salinisoli]|uniref:DUF5789 family protein n=1 Tax=Haladaptatus salinisoli TaxID=2884876 RepID=UPI001D0A6076|nr:hypothetical protein [Haladaptatus salinisoli]